MEFQYKKRKLIFYIICLLLAVYIIIVNLSNYKDIEGVHLIGSIFLLFAGIIGTSFYWKNLNVIVTVDETKISLKKNNSTVIQANWENVDKVEVGWFFEDWFVDADLKRQKADGIA